MERYIDADKYKADLLVGQEYLDEDTLLTAVNLLDCQPTADVVEVVRCRDCCLSSEPKTVSRLDLYCYKYDVVFCRLHNKNMCGDSFCNGGRKEN